MSKFLIKMSLMVILATILGSCGQGPPRHRKKPPPSFEQLTMPAKNTKVAFVFPAGAGAMRVILGITQKLEEDLKINALGSVIDVAGGVSSGSLVAAALTFDNPPKINSADLKAKIGRLVRDVFPHTNDLIDKLVDDYNFSLDELEQLFLELTKSPPKLSSIADAKTDLEKLLLNAAKSKFSIKSKIDAKGSMADFITAITPSLNAMVNFDTQRATILANQIKDIIGDSSLSDPKTSKMLVFATADKKPAFFGPAHLKPFVTGPYALGTTKLHQALLSSSAIPNFIKAPTDINFTLVDGSVKNIPDLIDGVFGTEGRFDPSATYYEIFQKQFEGENLLIVFVGNGAKVDSSFRGMLQQKYGFDKKISQHTNDKGKTITYVAIDTKIVDDQNNDLFNLSGFYDNKDLEKYMDDAASKAVTTPAYDWVLRALQAVAK